MPTIEKTGTARAKIEEGPGLLRITIPAKKNFLLIIGPVSYLAVLWVISNGNIKSPLPQFGQKGGIQLIFWGIGALILVLNILTLLFAKEVITIESNNLTIKKPVGPIFYSKSYNLQEARLFRAETFRGATGDEMEIFAQNVRNWRNIGTICFEYGIKTIRFGKDLHEA